jgi:CRP-like cAMP-binding protein
LILLCVARRRTLAAQEIVRSKGSIQWRSGGRCSNVHTCTKSRYYLALALSAAWREKLWSIEDQIRFYSQGEPTENVLYIQKGGIKLSVVNDVGKEAIVAMLGPGDFFGEGGMAGQPVRMGMAIVIVP